MIKWRAAPIEFNEGKNVVSVEESDSKRGEVLVRFSSNGCQYIGVYLNKELYQLLEQAMPHIKAIVENEK